MDCLLVRQISKKNPLAHFPVGKYTFCKVVIFLAGATSEYQTAQETAQAWGASKRWVNMCIASGRVPGAVKAGRQWLVPKGAAKPCGTANPGSLSGSVKPAQNALSLDFTRVVNAISLTAPRTNPDAVLSTVSEERLRVIHEGALAYARGDFARTIHCYLQNKGDDAAQLYAAPLAIAAAISTGDYTLYTGIENFLNSVVQTNTDAAVVSFAQLALSNGYLGAMAANMVPDWLKSGDFSALPQAAKPMAANMRAKYFQCMGDHSSMLAVAETACGLCHSDDELSFSDTYMTLLRAAACHALGRGEEAKRHLLSAMRMNLPNGFIAPFAELIPLYGGVMESLLKREYPEYHDAVLHLQRRVFNNWLSFHNRFTKDNITTILSLREYEIALMVARRVPRAQIAEQFHVSTGRLNNIMKEIYGKLFVSGREELSKYIL